MGKNFLRKFLVGAATVFGLVGFASPAAFAWSGSSGNIYGGSNYGNYNSSDYNNNNYCNMMPSYSDGNWGMSYMDMSSDYMNCPMMHKHHHHMMMSSYNSGCNCGCDHNNYKSSSSYD